MSPTTTGSPLAGRRVLVTRAAHQAGKLSEGLRALGAEPVEVPLLEIGPPKSFKALDRALHRIPHYDWFIFTSANTVRAVVDRATELGVGLAPAGGAQVAAVGEATAAALKKAGLEVTFVPENYVAESLLKGIGAQMAGKRVLLARASVARDLIPAALKEAGAVVDVADAYQNVVPHDAPDRLREALNKRLDAATFTSSSSVTHLAHVAEQARIVFPLFGVPAISIGPITSKTLREHGWEPAAEADPHDVPGLVAAVEHILYKS
jgi:uroporphyrinogen-III synthase